MSLENGQRSCQQHPPTIQQVQDQIRSTCDDIIHFCTQQTGITFYHAEQALRIHISSFIRRYLSGGGLLAIVHKRFMIRQFKDGFESQPGASRSGIPLGVSPFGIDPQVTDHSVEGPTVPESIAMTQGTKQLWQSIGGRHGSLACRDHHLKQMFSCMSQETFYC